MGYFDGLVEAAFKKDAAGRTVFYPWGVMARGRVVRDAEQEAELRLFLRRYYQAVLFGCIALGVMRAFTLLFLFAVFGTLYFIARYRGMLGSAPISDDRMSLGEAYRNSASKHSLWMLWMLLGFSLLAVAMGVWVLLRARTGLHLAYGAFFVVLFGACSAAFAYMIRSRRAP